MSLGFTCMRPTRVALAVSAIAAWLLVSVAAQAAQITEVRVGTHPEYTRVVLELDAPAGYRLVEPRAGESPEIQIALDAQGAAKQIEGSGALVEAVRVEPGSAGSTVRIAVKDADVRVTEMILASPPRIVIDVAAAQQVAAAPAAPEPSAEAVAEPATPKAAESARIAASEPPAESAAPEPAQSEPMAEAPSVAAAAAPSAETSMPAELDPGESEPLATAGEQQPLEFAAAPGSLGSAHPPVTGAPGDGVEAAEATEGTASALPAATAPPKPPVRTETIPVRKAEPAASGGLLAMATGPVGMGVGALLLAVVVFTVMRRRRPAEDPLSSVMSAEDAGMVSDGAAEPFALEAPEAPPTDDDLAMEPVPKQASAASDSIFDADSEPVASAPIAEIEPAAAVAPPPPTPAPAAPAPVAAESAELVGRIAELEGRLESLMESRERLERQVAAQTEELRVQRAAIARTQRVVRSMGKPEDAATEPVPRSPDS